MGSSYPWPWGSSQSCHLLGTSLRLFPLLNKVPVKQLSCRLAQSEYRYLRLVMEKAQSPARNGDFGFRMGTALFSFSQVPLLKLLPLGASVSPSVRMGLSGAFK